MGTTIELSSLTSDYDFPPGGGRGQRLSIVEPRGGFHDSDVAATVGRSTTRVSGHSVQATCDGLPLTGNYSPLDAATIGRVMDVLDRTGDAGQAASDFAADGVWTKFLATVEATLDVSVAAALAPEAEIDVWFTPMHTAGLASGIDHAVAAGAAAISISWGQSESSFGRAASRTLGVVEAAIQRAADAGVVVCCASGDFGSLNQPPGGDGVARVNYPASSRTVLACGATMRSGDAADTTEVVWNAVEYGVHHASGGGFSGTFPRPDHQSALPAPASTMDHVWRAPGTASDFVGRGVPDVAALAGPYRLVVGGRTCEASGTSASTPIWAALVVTLASALGRPPGDLVQAIYAGGGAGCTPITSGDDSIDGAARTFSAGPGWDPCTGWGTPKGNDLLALLRQRST
jgi:kumamolisin